MLIFAFLSSPGDWAACRNVCKLWRDSVPLARPRRLEYRQHSIAAMMWLARHSRMLIDLRSCILGPGNSLDNCSGDAAQALLRLVFTSARKLEVVTSGVSAESAPGSATVTWG